MNENIQREISSLIAVAIIQRKKIPPGFPDGIYEKWLQKVMDAILQTLKPIAFCRP